MNIFESLFFLNYKNRKFEKKHEQVIIETSKNGIYYFSIIQNILSAVITSVLFVINFFIEKQHFKNVRYTFYFSLFNCAISLLLLYICLKESKLHRIFMESRFRIIFMIVLELSISNCFLCITSLMTVYYKVR